MSESEQFVAQRGRTWTDVNKFLLENLRRTVGGVQKESGHYRVTAPTSRRADPARCYLGELILLPGGISLFAE